jgi:hypothetical protein
MLKKIILIALVYLNTGCSTSVPISTQLRSTTPVTDSMAEQCPRLKLADPNGDMNTTAKTIAENYDLYHKCAAKVNAWISWSAKQPR